MLRPIYLIAMGSCIGALTAAACGHAPFWVTIGAALGVAWAAKAGPAPQPRLRLQYLPALA